jgi:DNA-binding beta-propeller fold protein YncE
VRVHVATVAAVAALAVCACGSAAPAELPAPAGPAPSPPLEAVPAGKVVAIAGARPAAPVVVAAGRTLRTRGNRLEAVRQGRVHASRPTCVEPVALAVAGKGADVAVLCGRERVLELYDAATLERIGRAAAGIGPARLATDGGHYLYVTDTVGGSVLVFRAHPHLELTRRVALPGGPYAIAYDGARWALWITLTARNRVVEYAAGAIPVPRHSYPSVRSPTRVGVDSATARVTVFGARQAQVLDPPIRTR